MGVTLADIRLTYDGLLELYCAAFQVRGVPLVVPSSATEIARDLWVALWPGEPWPDGWVVDWRRSWELPAAGVGGETLGFCDRDRRLIALNHDALLMDAPERVLLQSWLHNVPKCPLYTLVHEFLHARGLDHRTHEDHLGFHTMTEALVARLWKEAA